MPKKTNSDKVFSKLKKVADKLLKKHSRKLVGVSFHTMAFAILHKASNKEDAIEVLRSMLRVIERDKLDPTEFGRLK